MIELDDCGKELLLDFAGWGGHHQSDAKIQMVIKAPRGTIALFDQQYASPDSQCEGIRAFMKEHLYHDK